MKAKGEGDVSGVKDIVRAMAIVGQMVHVAQLLRLLRQMQEEGLVTVLHFKERFLRSVCALCQGMQILYQNRNLSVYMPARVQWPAQTMRPSCQCTSASCDTMLHITCFTSLPPLVTSPDTVHAGTGGAI